MSYIPTTEEIRQAATEEMAASGAPFRNELLEERFDRWLNEELAKAWEEGAESAFYNPEIRDLVDYPEDNPYRTGE